MRDYLDRWSSPVPWARLKRPKTYFQTTIERLQKLRIDRDASDWAALFESNGHMMNYELTEQGAADLRTAVDSFEYPPGPPNLKAIEVAIVALVEARKVAP